MFSQKASRAVIFLKQAHSSSRIAGNVIARSAATSASVSKANGPATPNQTPSKPKPTAGAESLPSATVSEAARDYNGDGSKSDWSRSYHGLSLEPFPKETAEVLQASLNPEDIEIKPGKLTEYHRIAIFLHDDERRTDIPS